MFLGKKKNKTPLSINEEVIIANKNVCIIQKRNMG